MKVRQIVVMCLALLMLASCTSYASATTLPPSNLPAKSQPQEAATQMPSDNSSENSVSPINTLDSSETTPPPANSNPFIRLAEEDLARQLKINIEQINFLKISEIDWQDITQGCTTTPGQTLTKGRVSGYRIWLEANGKNYLYHIGLDNTIFLCPDQP